MEIRTFYAVTAATGCALEAYRRSLVRDQTNKFRNEATRRPAGDAGASFLIPGNGHYSVKSVRWLDL